MKSGLSTTKNLFSLNILLGFLLIVTMILVARDILDHHFAYEKVTAEKMVTQKTVSLPASDKQLSDYASILKNNPFGFPAGELKPLTGSAGSKTQKGDVVLVGTVVGPRHLSYAIFRDATGKQEVFKIGEPVYDIGTLSRVEREKVLVKGSGGTQEIPLEDVKVKEVSKRTSAAAPSSTAFAQRTGKSTYVVDQARLQQAIANPGQMMTDARLRPNIVNGKEEGFVLSEVKPGGIYDSLGLQNGDVLLRINDYDISNPDKALQAFTALRGLDRVQLDLVRAGSRMTITYQIR